MKLVFALAVASLLIGQPRETKPGVDRPVVVLLTMPGCRPCVDMRRDVMPALLRSGLLKRMWYTEVDLGQDGEWARELSKGRGYPQLLVFRKVGDRWYRWRWVGRVKPDRIVDVIEGVLHWKPKRPGGT